MKIIPALLLIAPLVTAACVPDQPERPMDEVPQQRILANGEREYRFVSGCVVVLHPRQAILKSETGACELYHRDIALLYASGD